MHFSQIRQNYSQQYTRFLCVDLSNALSPPVICTGRVEPTCPICLALRVSTIAVFPGVPLAFMARRGTVETPSGEGDHLARYVS